MSKSNPNLTSGDETQSESDDDFEFAIGCGSSSESNPVYPVFNRNLLADSDPHAPLLPVSDLRSGSASSTSSADDYCIWIPNSPNRRRKSSSTGSGPGSSSRWFGFRDLVSRRSRSDGKEKLVLIEPEKARIKKANPNPNLRKNVKEGEMDLLTAYRLFYGREGENGVKGGRAYVPNRSGSLGLFANGNGLSRTKFPFN